jgi:ATP-binding cassette subfamily C protein CydC
LKDVPVLVFDEPTANLDPVTEKRVLDTLFEIMKSRTSILITHRLVGLEKVDEIFVMDHGKIVERGVHEELIVGQGVYQRLWTIQNRLLLDF